jgi:predicted nucleic acid-binding protein
MVTSHSRHAHAFGWVKRAKAREFEAVICSHTLAELYSVLTSMPLRPRISPFDAARLIEKSVLKIFPVISLAASDHARILRSLAERNLPGGIVYDALLASAAKKARADSLLTLNPRDFQRLWQEGDPGIIEP